MWHTCSIIHLVLPALDCENMLYGCAQICSFTVHSQTHESASLFQYTAGDGFVWLSL